jgi:hypothetical protein
MLWSSCVFGALWAVPAAGFGFVLHMITINTINGEHGSSRTAQCLFMHAFLHS